MATTTNYSWTTPDDTALVKDGAAAIRSLGTAIDTTVFNNAGAAIAKTIVDAKGDIIAATAADTVSRLAVGANDTILTADSSTATGLKWAAPAASGGMTLLSTTTLSGASTTISSINQGYKNLEIVIYGVTNATADGYFKIDPNGSNNITSSWGKSARASVTVGSAASPMYLLQADNFEFMTRTNSDNVFNVTIPNYTNATNSKSFIAYGYFYNPSAPNSWAGISTGVILTNSAITSLVFTNTGGNFSTGTVLIYGVS